MNVLTKEVFMKIVPVVEYSCNGKTMRMRKENEHWLRLIKVGNKAKN